VAGAGNVFSLSKGLCLLLTAALAGLTQADAAQETDRAEKLSVTFAIGWQSHCRMGQWAPVEVHVSSSLDEPFIGYLELSNVQDELHRMQIHRPIVVPAHQSRRVSMVTKVGWESDNCRVTLRDRRGRQVFTHAYDLHDYHMGRSTVTLLLPGQTLLAVSGRGGLHIPVFGDPNEEREESLQVCYRPIGDLPAAWPGYCGLDVLVLYDPDVSLLGMAQVRALVDWIHNGGQMMLILGPRPIPPDSALRKLIPFAVGEPRVSRVPAGVLGAWGIDGSKPVSLSVWQLETSRLPAGWRVLEELADGRALRVCGSVGFGQVVVCAVDPVQVPLRGSEQTEQFWSAQLSPFVSSERLKAEGQEALDQWGGQVDWTAEGVGCDNILSYLLGIAEMRPISLCWVLATLCVMGLLIGPVDYLVLKRLGRLPWTYVTFAGVLAVFTVGSYYSVQLLRAGDTQLRRLRIVDKVDGTDCCWLSGYTGIFAARSDDYALDGVRGDSWWSGISPSRQWYGFGRDTIQSLIGCVQQEGNTPVSLPINIWSMRTLLDEGPTDVFPLTAAVQYDGREIRAEITNVGSGAVASGAVRLEDVALPFGRIDPGQTIHVSGQGKRPERFRDREAFFADGKRVDAYAHTDDTGIIPWLALGAAGSEQRAAGIQRWLDQGAAVVYAALDEQPASDVSLRQQAQRTVCRSLVRLVIPLVQTGDGA